MAIIMDDSGNFLRNFLIPYSLQATLHARWRKRNERRHDTFARQEKDINKILDRLVKNRCLVFCQLGDQKYAGGLSLWLATR